jgi:hypothetical protein
VAIFTVKLHQFGPYSSYIIQYVHVFASDAHNRQSAKPFLQSSELGLPTPSPAGVRLPHPLFGSGGGGAGKHSLAGEGVGNPNFFEGTDTVVL